MDKCFPIPFPKTKTAILEQKVMKVANFVESHFFKSCQVRKKNTTYPCINIKFNQLTSLRIENQEIIVFIVMNLSGLFEIKLKARI